MLPSFLVLLAAGFFAQFVGGTLGMGYGVTSATLLISLGVYPAMASASVHTAEVFVSLVSGVSHFKLGNVRKDIFLPLALLGMVGGVFGAYGLVNLPTKPIRLVVGCVLLAMGSVILYRFSFKPKENPSAPDRHHSYRKLAFLGFFAALIDAIGGGGWGPICTPSLIITGSNPRQVVGSVNFAEFFVTVAITITFIWLIGFKDFRWDIVAALLVAGLIAAPIAAFTCKKLPHPILGLLIGIAVIVLSVRMILKAIGI